MQTDYTPHCPQAVYTATIEITGTSEELAALYNLLIQTEASEADEQRIKDYVLSELREAHSWITDMEHIARRIGEKTRTHFI